MASLLNVTDPPAQNANALPAETIGWAGTIGASLIDNPYAVAGIKYSKHSAFVQYDTKNGVYGVEYLFWLK